LLRKGADGVVGTADDEAVTVTIDTRAQGQTISILPGSFLTPGDYVLKIDPSIIADRSGNHLANAITRNFTIRPASDVRAATGFAEITQAPSANPGQAIGLAVPFDPATAWATFQVIDINGTKSTRDVQSTVSDQAHSVAFFQVPIDAVTGDAVVFSKVGNVRTDFVDGTFLLQIIPVIRSMDVTSVSSDGSSAQVTLFGLGFVEGNASEYRFGTTSVVDGSTGQGPDVYYDYTNGYIVNGSVSLTVPLINGAFGPISVKTAGGVSAPFSLGLTGITGVALSGTPADATKASANPGQAVTLQGSGLSTSSDILLRYVDSSGTLRMVDLNPTAAAADGTSATLVVPTNANGAFALQMLGSSSAQPILQVVPTLTSYDVSGTTLTLNGSGLEEGNNTLYQFAGTSVTDTASNTGPDVSSFNFDNGRVNFSSSEPVHGLGAVTVTTAGGTSAALNLNEIRASQTTLGDIAIDPSSGALWVVDSSPNPNKINRIDPANGTVQQSITLTTAGFGSTTVGVLAGLQVTPSVMTLNGTAVAAGSLLLFNGTTNPDRVTAVNPTTGNVIATLVLGANYDLSAGLYDPTSGHLFVIDRRTPQRIVEINPANAAEIASFALPFATSSNSGLAINPQTGNIWYGSDQSTNVVELTRTGTVLRTVSLISQGVDNNEISGLAFDAQGNLYAASSYGVVYKVIV
jgi:hypothetical protein